MEFLSILREEKGEQGEVGKGYRISGWIYANAELSLKAMPPLDTQNFSLKPASSQRAIDIRKPRSWSDAHQLIPSRLLRWIYAERKEEMWFEPEFGQGCGSCQGNSRVTSRALDFTSSQAARLRHRGTLTTQNTTCEMVGIVVMAVYS